MKPSKEGYRVAVVGASSLLGKELLTVLDEQAFPVSRLVTFEADEEEPDLPIVDLREDSQVAIEDRDVSDAELDIAFLAVRPQPAPAFLSSALQSVRGGMAGSAESLRGVGGEPGHCFLIDLAGEEPGEELVEAPAEGAALHRTVQGATQALPPLSRRVSVPFLDRHYPPRPAPDRSATRSPELGGARLLVSAHPAVIMISSLLLRLAARFPLERAVAQVFLSASEIGPRAIEELQKQTVSLLSFQKIPHKVFGTQLAFNLLARLGRSGETHLPELETRLRRQLQQYLEGRVPLPALRLVQAPVFYSLALSLYVETARIVAQEEVAAALPGERVRVRRLPQDAPTQVEAVGSGDILVDAVTIDAAHPTGIWLWAVADNLRLAALNAVEIAKNLARNI